MEHILEHRKKITEQLVKSYGEKSPSFIVIGHSEAGNTALTAILNALEKSQSTESLNIFVDNNIDESKHQVPSAIDSIVLKGFSVEQLLIIKEDTQGKLEKSYIPELIDLIKAEDSAIEEKYKKKIAALKERRNPEGIEKADEDEDSVEKSGEGSRGGKVIGHTKSGKPIYEDHNHNDHKNFTEKDHIDAARLKNKLLDKKHFGAKLKEAGGLLYLPTEEERLAAQKEKKETVDPHIKNAEKIKPGSTQDRHGYIKIFKSEELTPGEIQKARIIGNIQDTYNTNLEEAFEKGGKRAEIGEVRMWGKDKWVKHQDGWVNISKTGKATLERPGGRREEALVEHGESKIGFTSKISVDESKVEKRPTESSKLVEEVMQLKKGAKLLLTQFERGRGRDEERITKTAYIYSEEEEGGVEIIIPFRNTAQIRFISKDNIPKQIASISDRRKRVNFEDAHITSHQPYGPGSFDYISEK